jgi:hypothetical protein
MGASFCLMKVEATKTQQQVREAFQEAQERDRYENGHSYSGGFGMAAGLAFNRARFERADDADEWLQENCEKWAEAIAVRLNDGTWIIGAWCSS